MRHVAERLRSESITALYTSPHARALESARIMAEAFGCTMEVVPDLREIEFGEFEGLRYDDIAARYPELYREWMTAPTKVRFPGGEHFSELRVRVLRTFDEIRREREGQTVAVVSHGGVNRIVLADALGMPDEYVFRLAQGYAAMNLLTFIDGVPTVELMNDRLS